MENGIFKVARMYVIAPLWVVATFVGLLLVAAAVVLVVIVLSGRGRDRNG